jgi:glycosyltransferase involved in cell wall biosynthesis
MSKGRSAPAPSNGYPMNTLSIIIPAYNEEDGIADIAQRVLAVRDALAQVGVPNLELIVVDDGSADQTAAVVSQIADVRLIRHPQNRGYGAALKTGFGQAQGNLIGFLDADGTYPPEYFPQLCTAALNGAELVIGSRMAGADSEMPLTRRIGNFFFANLLSLVGRQRISDSASGMRVFHRDLLERLYPLPDGLNLTPVMSTRAVHEGVAMTEIPIPYSERENLGTRRIFHQASKLSEAELIPLKEIDALKENRGACPSCAWPISPMPTRLCARVCW